MTREIIIDTDTKVGFGFQSKQFFIDNKGTRTTRKGETTEEGAKQAKRVLDIVAPDNTITWQTLRSLAETPELITSLSCTMEDTGAFIKTITLNDYDYYSLVIDCPLHKLYIMNTDKVYDLTLNIDPQTYQDDLISFYERTLGLAKTKGSGDTREGKDLEHIIPSVYELLLSYYSPKITNVIASRRDTSTPLYYNNLIQLSNYNEEGSLTYSLTVNPNNEQNPVKLGDIIGLDVDTKTISLINTTEDFSTFPRTEDYSLYIQGVSLNSGSDSYTDDGTYTWTGTNDEANTMTVQEPFPFNFSFPYPKVYWEAPRTTITSISNPTASVTVSDSTGFNVGDTLTIIGSYKKANDGNYEIVGINGNTITFSTVPPVSLTSNCGIAVKLTYVGEVESITNSIVITLRENPLVTIPANYYISVGDEYDKCVQSVSGRTITLKLAWSIPNYTPSYPTLSYNKLAEIVNVNVTSSSLEELPIGEFTVDTYEQCQNYIGLGGVSSYVPTLDTLESANEQVPDNIHFEQTGFTTLDVTVKGLYSEQYS